MADTDPILRPAIEAAVRAERNDPDDEQFDASNPNAVLVSYVVIATLKGFDDAGEDVSQTFILPEGSLTEQLGMITEAQIRYHADVLEGYRNG